MTMALMWIQPSVWQMLRGGSIIFTSIFSRIILKQVIKRYQLISILISLSGLVCVTVASMFTPSISPSAHKPTSNQQIAGISMVIIAQITASLQYISEQYVLGDYKVPSSLLVGLKGVTGL